LLRPRPGALPSTVSPALSMLHAVSASADPDLHDLSEAQTCGET
jgi:hypothetical protein